MHIIHITEDELRRVVSFIENNFNSQMTLR